jgi:sarcosine oxidase
MGRYDAIVIGLGGMGSAAAAHLARLDRRVLGVERFTPVHALGSSHGETRIVRQAYFEHPDYVPLARRAYELWDELAGAVGRPLLRRIGGLMLGPLESAVVAGTLRSARRWSLPHELLDVHAMAARYPQFRLGPGEAGVFEAVAGYVSPEQGVRAHLDVAARHGAELRFGTAVGGWDVRGDGVEVLVDGERIVADRLVVTAGAWTGRLTGIHLPLRPVRRVVGYFEPTGDRRAFGPERFPVYVFEVGAGDAIYGFPETAPGRGAKVGFHYRGPDVDPDDVDRTVGDGEIDELRAVLAERIPALAGRCLDASVCMYTMTPDEHFVIGTLPGTAERVVVAAGFSGHGFKFTPVVGEILAGLATTGTTPHPIDFLAPTRF